MSSLHSDDKFRLPIAFLILFVAIVASVLVVLRKRFHSGPLALTGAVIQKSDDARKQSPISDVVVSTGSEESTAPVKTNTSGFFKLVLSPNMHHGQAVTLHFRDPKYEPVDLKTTVNDTLYVIRMVPLQTDEQPVGALPAVVVSNVQIRYSTESSADVNIGTGVTTFEVPNVGNLPCDPHGPCSSDGKWKAAIAGASLDAGTGNEYRNARVFCIAGPCPFTKVVSDNFTRGGRYISVSILNWSDTTTFLFQAEVFRHQVSDTVRQSFPVIYGRTFNFSLPSAAEGPSLEAELDKIPITFPLRPDPSLSWATCSVIMGSRYSKSYRCELRPGFKFQ
jgi:hypothetical protein